MRKFDGRGKSLHRNKLRNLKQYKELSDEEFEQVFLEKSLGMEVSQKLEKRIEDKLKQFSEDYDLSDLKINDLQVLRALIQAIISLEDYEQLLFKIRSDGITETNILLVDKIQRVMSDLRKDISNFQNDLNITRKVRKSDQEQSVIAYIEGLKEKARQFYESRMVYVFCPKCKTLLGTLWVLYSDNDRNKLSLVCDKKIDDNTICGEKVTVSIKELYKNGGTNNKEIMPEGML